MIERLKILWLRWQAHRIFRRDQRALEDQQRRRELIKAPIRRVGVVFLHPHGYSLIAWDFDLSTHCIIQRYDRGRLIFCGYTMEELQEISVRRAEWVEITQC